MVNPQAKSDYAKFLAESPVLHATSLEVANG